MHRLIPAALAALALATTTQAATFVQAGRLLADPARGKVLTAKTLVIDGGRVVRIADGYISEPGGQVIDLKASFVMPGFIDSHVHLTSQQNPNARLEEVTQSSADQAMAGARYAMRTLLAGFTTVADLGADNNATFRPAPGDGQRGRAGAAHHRLRLGDLRPRRPWGRERLPR